jgi:hypothetical protein
VSGARAAAFSRRRLLRYGAMGLAAAMLPAAPRRVSAGGSADLSDIVACSIHPAIGVARVGNSPDAYFLGPEVPGPQEAPTGGYKDSAGRIKRQAARFRVFGLDADGEVVRELTSDDAQITWTVHLANKKAAWYNFDLAFDLPEASGQAVAGGVGGTPLSSTRRNAAVAGKDRARLTIDPGPRTIRGSGTNARGDDSIYAFDTGEFSGHRVPLGDLRTDDAGRLLVLGGFGNSAAADPNTGLAAFANNDGWYDDVADGPVEAEVRLAGRVLQAKGAWVVVGPPDFAPGIQSVVTMYDVLFEVATKLDPGLMPARPSFTRQIYPLLERQVQNQWVNAGFARQFGWGTAGNFLEPGTLAALARSGPETRSARDALFRRFRNPAFSASEPTALPPYYGDTTSFPAVSPRQWMAVLPVQYGWLQQWAAGDFDADWPAGGLSFPGRLEDLPPAEQPDALDRAALDECLGGPFHPGCELTWPMRSLLPYDAPFRLRRRMGAEQDWGDTMTPTIALSSSGPLSASAAGDLTRWMAVPWQPDTASCLSAYEPEVDEYLPAFWPARVPNDLLTADGYQTIRDSNATAAQKQAAFAARVKWLRGLPLGRGDMQTIRINAFLRTWSEFGIVTRRAGPTGDPAFPETFWVESDRSLPQSRPPAPAGPNGGT